MSDADTETMPVEVIPIHSDSFRFIPIHSDSFQRHGPN
jgi:hypothetical protein